LPPPESRRFRGGDTCRVFGGCTRSSLPAAVPGARGEVSVGNGAGATCPDVLCSFAMPPAPARTTWTKRKAGGMADTVHVARQQQRGVGSYISRAGGGRSRAAVSSSAARAQRLDDDCTRTHTRTGSPSLSIRPNLNGKPSRTRVATAAESPMHGARTRVRRR
jgi:hypothetical protein